MIRSRRRRIRNVFFAALLAVLAAVLVVDQWVMRSTRTALFSSIDDVPKRKVGLLLGTSKWVQGGRINLYYRYRIDAAVALYKAGKVEYILVSGDNSRVEYNEPDQMRDDLIAAGIPVGKSTSTMPASARWTPLCAARKSSGRRKSPSSRSRSTTSVRYSSRSEKG